MIIIISILLVAPIVFEVVGKLKLENVPEAPVKYCKQSGGPPWVSPHLYWVTKIDHFLWKCHYKNCSDNL